MVNSKITVIINVIVAKWNSSPSSDYIYHQ